MHYWTTLIRCRDVRVYSTQDGICIASAHTDDLPLQPPNGIGDNGQYHDTCVWYDLKAVEFETTFLIASAAINPNTPSFDPEGDETLKRSRVVIFELSMRRESGACPLKLIKICQWSYNGPVGGIEINGINEDALCLVSASYDGMVSSKSLKRTLNNSPTGNRTPDPTIGASPLPNPFKAMKIRYLEKPQTNDMEGRSTKSTTDEVCDLGFLQLRGPLLGIRMRHGTGQILGLAWSHLGIEGFICQERNFRVLFRQYLQGFIQLKWVDVNLYCAIYDDRIEFYEVRAVDAGCDPTPKSLSLLMQPSHQLTLVTGPFEGLAVPSPYEVVYTNPSKDGQRRFLRLFKSSDSLEESKKPIRHVLWEVSVSKNKMALPTSILPLEHDVIFQGYADGHIRRSSLSQSCSRYEDRLSSVKTSDPCINGKITSLHIIQNPRTKERYIISGASDGSIAFWTTNALTLCARWILFVTVLSQVIQVPVERTGSLRGCVLCVAQDGTIAVIALDDDFQFLYMVPGSAASLRRVCLSETNLLLIYDDRRARLWDTQSKEFWRSLSLDKAEELLPQGGWIELFLDGHEGYNAYLKMVSDGYQGPDSVSTLTLDIERFISDATIIMKTISTNKEQTKAIYTKLDQIRLLLSFLLTPGLNSDIDDICRTRLNIPSSSASVGFSSLDTSTLYRYKNSRDAWCISGDISAARIVAIVTVLRTLSLFEEYMDSAKTVSTFYVTSLTGCVGPKYQSPDLPFLAQLWFKSFELRQSCRTVFDASVVKLSDDEANILLEEWQYQLPSLHTSANKELTSSPLALYLCGYLSVEKYSIMSTDILRDVSKSLVLYLQEENPLCKVLAIDLCSRGFHVWQHYIDTMQILRSLFTLATNHRKDSISMQNVTAQARSAVLHIASSNTPLFMTTLGLDILNPPNVEHRRSVLQIVAFLIRKQPTVLHSNLARLMEAVVKSLDPNSTINRDAVLDTATEIIGQVVRTFPDVDFHGATQRLAVGSSEGAIVMYDLKTATRLYVLEGHKKRIASCSFSPDGRRLVTVSIDEGLVNVWKVGSSFASFFTPGAPPRQGHGGSQPYKSLNFHFGDISQLSGSLDSTKFEWVADRNVKVMIGPNTLNFNT
ncbi:hypothetical protein AX15_002671 [Amanita polypyramis BW_CC]|nr:hypothetical protein AX15_002671 [Amanita polypyramis BW_CC]